MSKAPVGEPRLPSSSSARLSNQVGPWIGAVTTVSLFAQLAFAGDPPATAPAPPATPVSATSVTVSTGAAPTSSDDAPPSEAQKTDAKVHFDKGLNLFGQQAWAPALAEFLRSREIYRTRNATRNAAVSLRKLQRYDEALAMFETMLREFPSMPVGERESAQREAAQLRDLVGTIDISGAEPGASMIVSGTDRGEYPPVVPLRVSAGSHIVRVVKEGFEPFQGRVDVAGGQSAGVVAKMKKLADSGRLKVSERGGLTLDVIVDTGLVGQTPWEGLVGIGPHAVQLRSKGKLGTPPASVVVKSQQTTTLALTAEDLDSSLRVEPTPIGATVAIDSVTVGSGVWIGRLKAGPHKVEVTADGFRTAVQDVTLRTSDREIVKVDLERDPDAQFWQKPPRIAFEFSAALPLFPSFGGDVAGRCVDQCAQSVGLGALGFGHGTYELSSGLGFGISLGYLFGTQSVTDRSTQLVPFNREGEPPPQGGTADDSLRLSAFLGGIHFSYRLGESFPVMFRLGAGVLVGQMRDERKGRFTGSDDAQYDSAPIVDRLMAIYGYLDFEPRVGVRLGKNLDLALGAQVLLLGAFSQPTWTQSNEVDAGTDGRGTYRAEPVMGTFVFGIAPTASFRYDF